MVGNSSARAAVAGLLGALGVGYAVSLHGIDGSYSAVMCYSFCGEVTVAQALPAAVLGAALLTALFVRGFGWLVAAGALAVGVGIFQLDVPGTLPSDVSVLTLGALAGVALGGALAAFARSDPAARAAIAAGFALGVVAGVWVEISLGHETDLSVELRTLVVPAGLCLVAGVLALATDGVRGRDGGRGVVTAIGVAVIAAAAVGANYVLIFQERGERRGDGLADRIALAQSADNYRVLHLIAAAVVAAALLGLVFVRGGARLAQWVVAGSAAGVVVATAYYHLDYDTIWATVAVMTAGAVAGALAALLAGRLLPWDMIGLGLAGVGLFLSIDRTFSRAVEQPPVDLADGLMAFGVAMALAAGLAGLAREGGRVLQPGPAAVSVATGVAGFLLTKSLLLPSSGPVVSDQGLPPVIWVLSAAVIGVVLFVLARRAPAPAAEETLQPVAVPVP